MDRKIIEQTAEHVKDALSGESTGHDWWHVHRVWKTAVRIGEEEGADMFVVEFASLLHDIADYKFHGGDETAGPRVARQWLENLNVDEDIISHVCEIVKDISFKGANVSSKMRTIEGKVVQDADRLDALGAIGIARCFATSSNMKLPIYDPDIKPKPHDSFEEYKTRRTSAINHFYEKLLLLKGMMNTESGKRMAEGRHEFMEEFLERFYGEWEGKN